MYQKQYIIELSAVLRKKKQKKANLNMESDDFFLNFITSKMTEIQAVDITSHLCKVITLKKYTGEKVHYTLS